MTRPRKRLRLDAVVLVLALGGCATAPDLGGPTAPADAADAGVLTLPNGRSYPIYPEDLAYTGKAHYRWPDGREFDGTLRAGRPHGIGTETLPSGERYVGDWFDGDRHGLGRLELADGSVYEGQFRSGLRQGYGVLEGSAGRYEGQWLAGLPHGHGEYHYNDGSVYAGEWLGGRRAGAGTYERANGSSYTGEWAGDVPHGFGRLEEQDGLSYEGEWVQGARQGYGRLESPAGVVYEGTWKADQRHGYGVETRPDGTRYAGEWRNDQRHGQGLATRADGASHDGFWEHNRPLGPGTRRDATGIEITGLWNADFVTSGILRLPGGTVYAGNLYDAGNTVVSARFVAWLQSRSELGNAYAQLLLAQAYSRFERPAPDPAEALHWYSRAAAKGVSEAQYQLAEILLEGDEQIARAISLLLDAARQGHGAANLRLGSYYQTGIRMPKNHTRAAQHYEIAAAQGNVPAMNSLAWLLATSPDETLRDGPRAVDLARPLAHLYETWNYYDTLAAAYAESSAYERAAEAEEQAISLAQDEVGPATLQALTQRLTLFRSRHPYREP